MLGMPSDRLARVLADDYAARVDELDLDEVRSRRGDCQEVELALSYARRIVQGRLDIIHSELERRTAGEGPSEVSSIVERLKDGEMLGQHARPPGFGRLPTLMDPGGDTDGFVAEADALAHAETLSALSQASDSDVRTLADELETLERSLSDRRRKVFDRIDVFQAEIVRRYKSGAATTDSLLSS
jgi:hypothetical protein